MEQDPRKPPAILASQSHDCSIATITTAVDHLFSNGALNHC